MGSYSFLSISGYPLLESKNSYATEIVDLIFQPEDYIEVDRPLSGRNRIHWGDAYEHDKGLEQVRIFRTKAKVCKERLEIFGSNLSKAKRDFRQALSQLKEDEVYSFAKGITYHQYLQEVTDIIVQRRKSYDESYDDFSKYLQYNSLMIEYQSWALALYSILSIVDPESIVEYDLTDIIEGAWVDENVKDIIQVEKIIILTEGKTDSEFLQAGMKIFYPHLKGYYHFMDFEASKYEGSASRLVHTIKSFVGSGIKNKIIAIFDNDSAAKQEIQNLDAVDLPGNIRVVRYPDIKLAKKYPTIGPTGKEHLNINGLAGSIELYLGRDILTENGKLIPIQWTGYLDKVKQYQGSIVGKNVIQQKFREKVSRTNPKNVKREDWVELIEVIEMIKGIWQ